MAANELRHRAQLVFGPELSVLGAESRLGQVFLNLLVNAAQAIPEGNVASNTIRVATRMLANGKACVEISDTGSFLKSVKNAWLEKPFLPARLLAVVNGDR